MLKYHNRLHIKELMGGIFIVLLIVFIQIYVVPYLRLFLTPEVLSQNVFLAIFLVAFYVAISHIFAPIVGAPVLLLSLSLLGPFITSVANFIGSMISSVVCFSISRRYGRSIVIKMLGEERMDRVDQFIDIAGINLLITSRLIGASVYEIISYAFGLTNIRFSTYFVTTLIGTFLWSTILYLVFRGNDFTNNTTILYVVFFLTVLEIMYLAYLWIIWKRRRKI